MKNLIHGRASTYNNHKCRCEPCRLAWNEYSRPRLKAYREDHPRPKSPKKPPNNHHTRKAERYDVLLKQQNGVCGICERKPILKFDEDHNHQTGEIRGLLCRSCNTALGKLGDDPIILQRAIDYLKKPPARSSVFINL